MMDKQRLKEIFGDGKRPTGADFAALIDSLWEDSEQTVDVIKKERVRWARSEYPAAIKPGEYWYNPSTGRLMYVGDYKVEEVALQDDVVYIIEDDLEMFPGQYVYRVGVLVLLGGGSGSGGGEGAGTGVYIGGVEDIG